MITLLFIMHCTNVTVTELTYTSVQAAKKAYVILTTIKQPGCSIQVIKLPGSNY